MKKKEIVYGLKAIEQKCAENKTCEKCELECYCQYRRVYGSPHLFPDFNNHLVMVKTKGKKLLITDLDDLFNTLNKICCATMFCDECIIKRECEKTCGFTIIPEFWKL